jgi:hypothetical protein
LIDEKVLVICHPDLTKYGIPISKAVLFEIGIFESL